MATKSTAACPTCNGSGGVSIGGIAQPCPVCDGTGQPPGLFYSYSLPQGVATLAGNASLTAYINILNAPFKWIFATAVSTGSFTIYLADVKNQRQFMNVPLDSRLLFGTAQNPFPVLNPWVFDQNGSIQIQLTDTSAATNNIWLGFIGVQLVSPPASAASNSSSSSSS